MLYRKSILVLFLLAVFACQAGWSQDSGKRIVFDEHYRGKKKKKLLKEEDLVPKKHAWGFDMMVSTDGFGFGGWFYRNFNDVVSAFVQTNMAESKDSREFETYDLYGNSYSINKINRIFRIPMFVGLQYRLFKDEIQDNFRPFVNGGAGPVFIYTTPAQEEFFSAFGDGRPYWSYGGFLGFGAQFGFDRSTILGVNFRYYFIPLPEGIDSVYLIKADGTAEPRYAQNASGFFITLTFGAAY